MKLRNTLPSRKDGKSPTNVQWNQKLSTLVKWAKLKDRDTVKVFGKSSMIKPRCQLGFELVDGEVEAWFHGVPARDHEKVAKHVAVGYLLETGQEIPDVESMTTEDALEILEDGVKLALESEETPVQFSS